MEFGNSPMPAFDLFQVYSIHDNSQASLAALSNSVKKSQFKSKFDRNLKWA